MKKINWIAWLIIFIALSVLFTLPFRSGAIDIGLQRPFYSVDNGWVGSTWKWVRFCDGAVPIAAGVWALIGFGLCLVPFFKKKATGIWRVGLFMCLGLALGPGILVNGICKDHAGRYRPRQIVDFGGLHHYEPPLDFDRAVGRSFPCGHSSIGFLFGTLALVVGARRKVLKASIVVGSLLLGLVLGWARMTEGAHFFSDVLWSGLIVWGAAGLVFYWVYHLPDEHWRTLWAARKSRPRVWMGGVTMIILLVVAILAATPFDRTVEGKLPESDIPETWVVVVPAAEVHIVQQSGPVGLSYHGKFQGFGLPRSRVVAQWKNGVLLFKKTGFFSDLDGSITLYVNSSTVRRMVVHGASGIKREGGSPSQALEVVEDR